MQFLAVLNIFIVKHTLILFLKMIKKENIFFRKMFIVTDLVSLKTKKCKVGKKHST